LLPGHATDQAGRSGYHGGVYARFIRTIFCVAVCAAVFLSLARRQVRSGRLVMGTNDHWPPVPRAPR